MILSGGMDSAAVLALLASKYPADKIVACSINYGQRHSRELIYARKLAEHFKVDHELIDLSCLRTILKGSSQTDDAPVPHGHYADESMKVTVVPNRNMILLSVAAAAAIGRGMNTVYYGAHAGDHAIYPDCRPPFVQAMKTALRRCHFYEVNLVAPYLHYSKAGILKDASAMGLPFELTYSCYEGGEKHCGKCGTCVERREAFVSAGVVDPTIYQE